MRWRNWLEEEVEVVLTVLNQAAEAAYSVQAFDWLGGRCRGKEEPSNRKIPSLLEAGMPSKLTDMFLAKVLFIISQPTVAETIMTLQQQE